MNFLKKAAIVLLLLPTIQSQAMLRTAMSRVRMPAAAMLRSARAAMPTRRSITVAKPIVNPMWLSPFAKRAAAGILGTAALLGSMKTARAEGQGNNDKATDVFPVKSSVVSYPEPNYQKPQVIATPQDPNTVPVEEQAKASRTRVKLNLDFSVKCDKECKELVETANNYQKNIASLIKEGINRELSPKQMREQVKLVYPKITEEELDDALKNYASLNYDAYCHNFDFSVGKEDEGSAQVSLDLDVEVPHKPDAVVKGVFEGYAGLMMVESMGRSFGWPAPNIIDLFTIKKIKHLSIEEHPKK